MIVSIDADSGAVLQDMLHFVEAGISVRSSHTVYFALVKADPCIHLNTFRRLMGDIERDIMFVVPAKHHGTHIFEVAVSE